MLFYFIFLIEISEVLYRQIDTITKIKCWYHFITYFFLSVVFQLVLMVSKKKKRLLKLFHFPLLLNSYILDIRSSRYDSFWFSFNESCMVLNLIRYNILGQFTSLFICLINVAFHKTNLIYMTLTVVIVTYFSTCSLFFPLSWFWVWQLHFFSPHM